MGSEDMKKRLSTMIPFGMTFGSVVMLLIIGLNGIPGNFMGPIFKIDTQKLAIPSADFTSLTGLNVSGIEDITAASMGLDDKYSFYLWGYASGNSTKTTYHQRGFDYVKNINISEVTIDGVSYSLPHKYTDIRSRLRTKIQIAEAAYLATLSNAFFVVAAGVAGWFGRKFSLTIVLFFTLVTLLTSIIFGAVITALGFGVKSDLKPFSSFGLKYDLGTSDLGIVWFAIIHMVVVSIIFALMAFGVLATNPLLKTPKNEVGYGSVP